MLLWIISLLTLAAAAADVIHYRRMRRRAPGVRETGHLLQVFHLLGTGLLHADDIVLMK